MLKNSVIVTFFLIISSLLSFFSQVVNANSFGATKEMDFYFKLVAPPSIITGIAPMIFSFIFLPYLTKELRNKNKSDEFVFKIFNSVFFFSVIFTVFGLLGTIFYYRFKESQNELNNLHFVWLSTFIWISAGLSITIGFLSAILNYKQKFVYVSWTSIFIPFFSILFVILLKDYIGVLSLSIATFLAVILQFFIFFNNIFSLKSICKISFFYMYFDKSLYKKIIYVFISLMPFTTMAPISYYFASTLDTGCISYIGFSQSFSGFVSVAAGMGISIVSFPDLVNNILKENIQEAKENMKLVLKYILILAMFISFGFISLKTPILSLFYGKIENPNLNIYQLSKIIPFYLISAIFISALNQIRTFYYAEGNYKKLAFLSILILIIFSILSWGFIMLFDFYGIGIANLISIFMFFILSLYFIDNRGYRTMLKLDFFLFFLKIIILFSIVGFLTYQEYNLIISLTSSLLSIFISGLSYLIVIFYLSNFVFKIKEFIIIKNYIKKIL